MPSFLNKMRALFSEPDLLDNYQLDSNLKSIVDRVKEIEPSVYPCFSVMYFTGCRASESFDKSLWLRNQDNSYILHPLKNNNVRYFSSFEIPFEFQLFLESSNALPSFINYEKLRYLFKSFSLYPRIWIGNKESTLHLYRHNYVKKLIDQGFTNEEIQIKLGEKSMKSALSYIESRYRI